MSSGQAISTNTAPQTQEYAGDEINAIVLDPGACTIRAGFAGEDVPKSVVPSFYGIGRGSENNDKQYFGDNTIHNPSLQLDIKTPFDSESLIEDWDVATKLFEYTITSRLLGPQQTLSRQHASDEKNGEDGDVDMDKVVDALEKPMEESPLLMTEPAWNPPKSREKTMEMAFESWGTPAFWIGRTGMLSA